MKSGTFTLVALGVLLACHPCWAQSETEPPAHEGRVLVKYAQGQQRGARGLNGFEVFPLLEGEVVDNVVETLLQQEGTLRCRRLPTTPARPLPACPPPPPCPAPCRRVVR